MKIGLGACIEEWVLTEVRGDKTGWGENATRMQSF